MSTLRIPSSLQATQRTSQMRFAASFRIDANMINQGADIPSRLKDIKETTQAIQELSAQLASLPEELVFTHKRNKKDEEGILIQDLSDECWASWPQKHITSGYGSYVRKPAKEFILELIAQLPLLKEARELVKKSQQIPGPKLLGEG